MKTESGAPHLGRRCFAAFTLSALTFGVAVAAAASVAQPWQSLPPTPELPAPDRQEWAQVNGIRLWYARYGVGHPGPTVLLLHGGFASSNYYGHLIPALLAKGYPVLAIDSRGQGRSSASSAPFSYRLLASDVIGLLKLLAIPSVDIVGWSDGGIVGLEMALHHPQTVHRLFAFGANASLNGLKPSIEKSPVFARYLARTKEEFSRLSPTPAAYDSRSKQIMAMWSHEPNFSRQDLKRISVPVTIADGQYDEAIRPEHVAYMASVIPDANVVTLPNASHFAMLQSPEQFNDAVLAFLKYR